MGRERDIGEVEKLVDTTEWRQKHGFDDQHEHYPDDRRHPIPNSRPRYKRQVIDAYGDARRNNDPFNDEPAPTFGDDPRRFDAWKRLTAIAKEHAVMLRPRPGRPHHYRADRIGDVIDREVIPQAREILRGVAPVLVDELLSRFVEFLWSEIEKK